MQSSAGDSSPRSIAKSGSLEFTAAANLLSANPDLIKEFKEVLQSIGDSSKLIEEIRKQEFKKKQEFKRQNK